MENKDMPKPYEIVMIQGPDITQFFHMDLNEIWTAKKDIGLLELLKYMEMLVTVSGSFEITLGNIKDGSKRYYMLENEVQWSRISLMSHIFSKGSPELQNFLIIQFLRGIGNMNTANKIVRGEEGFTAQLNARAVKIFRTEKEEEGLEEEEEL